MLVMMAYNEPILPVGHPEAESEHEIVDVVDAIASHLTHSNFELRRQAVGRDLETFRNSLHASRPDVVFNLFEGFGDDPTSEIQFARLLEDEGIAFTGAPSQTLWQAGRKDIAKQLFRQAGLTTPDSFIVDRLPLTNCRLNWPVIVKPAFRDASIGIDQASVATNLEQLENGVARIAREYGFPVLVEEFIPGREISAAVVEWPNLVVLPIVETVFAQCNGNWPIDSYDAKWQSDSVDHEAVSLRYPAELAHQLADRVIATAREAFRALGCCGFATADFRLDAQGELYLLEINPNANLKPSSCLLDLFRGASIDYSEFLIQLVHAAKAKMIRA